LRTGRREESRFPRQLLLHCFTTVHPWKYAPACGSSVPPGMALVGQVERSETASWGVMCDGAIENDVDRLYREARSGMGRVGVLIHRTGITDPSATLKNIPNEGWQTTLQVKLTGKFEPIEPEILNISWPERTGTQLNNRCCHAK
jgi:NAD(P)-dependent dehydrogenase (short-subunit alcohol dehydrogenase family)